ncbi:MAG: Calx-beta domain-containing protein, partial [Planctomycetota bacterium]|nr:Calx-beta domain-containing protein [Planctomycetota bacterium]
MAAPNRLLAHTALWTFAALTTHAPALGLGSGLNPEVAFQVPGSTLGEAAGSSVVTVVLSATSSQDVFVPFTVGGSATSADATVDSGPLVIPAGQLSGIINIAAIDDVDSEGTERVTFALGTPVGGVLGAIATHEVVIEDDEAAATLAFDFSTSSVSEGAVATSIALSLSSVRTEAVVLDFTAAGSATAGGVDLSITPASSLVIPGGSLAASLAIDVIGDSMDEPDEDLVVSFSSLSNADYGGLSQHTLTILDDDSAPSVSFAVANATVVEDDPTAPLAVELSSVSGFDVTVPISASGDATEGVDFTFAPSTLTILAGNSTGIVDVTLLDDTDVEGEETAIFTLGTPVGATPGALTSTALLIIDDDDPEPQLSFTSASSVADEDGGVQDLTLLLDG